MSQPPAGPTLEQFIPCFGAPEIEEFEQLVTADERAELDAMFAVAEVINPQRSDFVTCSSLYCRPHDPEKKELGELTLAQLQAPHPSIKGGLSWWDNYMVPLLRGIQKMPEPWSMRLYLAPDLISLLPYFCHARLEIRIMKHCSVNTMPGMLWRYLPAEEGVTLMARGADSFCPNPTDWGFMQRMLAGPNRLLRMCPQPDVDRSGFLTYRSVPGPIVLKPIAGLAVTQAAKAWIWHQRYRAWQSVVTVQDKLDSVPRQIKKFGMTHWARYGQDEQFLSHWLYYRAAPLGIHSVVRRTSCGSLWKLDLDHLRKAAVWSHVDEI
jgi:hypothetical protein